MGLMIIYNTKMTALCDVHLLKWTILAEGSHVSRQLNYLLFCAHDSMLYDTVCQNWNAGELMEDVISIS